MLIEIGTLKVLLGQFNQHFEFFKIMNFVKLSNLDYC